MDVQLAGGRKPLRTLVRLSERLDGRIGKLVEEGGGEVVRRAWCPQRVDELLQCDVGDRAEQINQRGAQVPQRPDRLLALVRGARPARDQGGDLLAVQVLGQERGGRGGGQVHQGGELIRGAGDRGPPVGQHLRCLRSRVEHDTAHDGGPDRVHGEFELGDHAEVAAAAPQRPEQVGVFLLAGPHQLTVGRYHLGREQVVAGQPVLAHQMADAAAQREATDPGRGNQPARGRQPMDLGLMVEPPPGHAALRQRPAAPPVHPHRGHRGQVEHDTTVAGGEPGDTVCAAADRHRQPLAARELHPGDDVGDAGTAEDERRVAVDRVVPDPPGSVVAGVARGDHRSQQPCPEFGQRRLAQNARAAPRPLRAHFPS